MERINRNVAFDRDLWFARNLGTASVDKGDPNPYLKGSSTWAAFEVGKAFGPTGNISMARGAFINVQVHGENYRMSFDELASGFWRGNAMVTR